VTPLTHRSADLVISKSWARSFAPARQNFWHAALSAAKLLRMFGAEPSQDFADCGETPAAVRSLMSKSGFRSVFWAGGINNPWAILAGEIRCGRDGNTMKRGAACATPLQSIELPAA